MTTITLDDGSPRTLPRHEEIAGSNCGTPGVWHFAAPQPGPRIVLTALVHGNEVCGAEAAWWAVQQAPRPRAGSLTVVFCNLAAYERLDDGTKGDCRLVDEDMNRVWGRVDPQAGPSDTTELRRAREILPHVAEADVLLDLHSMTEAAPALGLVGRAPKNLDFARRLGFPGLLVQDAGHAAGLRLIDRPPYGDPTAAAQAMLVECGAHFSPAAFEAAHAVVGRLLASFLHGENAVSEPQTVIEVTEAVTIRSDDFEFTQDWPNMGCVTEAGTLVARDGGVEVRTPGDNTFLIMPASARFRRPGLTAVRFGRRVA
ncbi:MULTISPECIES: succinylglutamate desuccinylase/aspartoacylase family protein [Ramlibacter]|uniref:Succinylglutamate desuccinylase/aspartoacylase family protein n=1 Tax=Ramlibacter aquaticus TaxID=2780094 RepID=A0ABR9SC35_9BURK|nr:MULTISPECIES: succinylglutamate desuccinylase/aspartoacylase family protein [Ramlibacter]MBE7939909.1 succinylglutamate desuccinylase/aspartoacylase family protein [Ramlibacter aquaticus]